MKLANIFKALKMFDKCQNFNSYHISHCVSFYTEKKEVLSLELSDEFYKDKRDLM